MSENKETYESVVQQRDALEKKLLAYEQAAKNPIGSFHISGGQVEATTDYCRDGEWPVQDGEVLVYAAPVLPKQPDATITNEGDITKIIKAAEKLVRCKGRYHSEQNYRALAALFGVTVPDFPPLPSDEAPAQPVIPIGLVQEINRLLDNDGSRGRFSAMERYDARKDLELLLASAAQQNEPQNIPENIPAQPVIPGQLTQRMAEEKALSLGAVLYDEEAEVFADGWNACRAEMLKAQPVSEPYKLPYGVINALTLVLQAMELMGDTLNELDALCGEDVEFVTPEFEALRNLLAAAQARESE